MKAPENSFSNQPTTEILFSEITPKTVAVSPRVHQLRQAIEQIRLAGEAKIRSRNISSEAKERINRFLQFVNEVNSEIRAVEKGEAGKKTGLATLSTGWAVELSLAANGVALENISPAYHHLVAGFSEACMLIGKIDESESSSDIEDEIATFEAAIDFIVSEAFADNNHYRDLIHVSLPAQLNLRAAA